MLAPIRVMARMEPRIVFRKRSNLVSVIAPYRPSSTFGRFSATLQCKKSIEIDTGFVQIITCLCRKSYLIFFCFWLLVQR